MASAGALVAGFSPLGRLWVSEAEAAGDDPVEPLPRLDGTIHFDERTRAAASRDTGNIAHALPWAVLRPGSVADVAAMIRYCRRHDIPVSARGQHHTTFGQGLTTGLIVETTTPALSRIHAIGPTHVTVGAGVTWKTLVAQTLERGLRPKALLGYQGLTAGGTLAIGGCPMTDDHGGLVETVSELLVVTGKGETIACSATRERELFDAARGGLGQCGIIVRATIDLVPALPLARTYYLTYVDVAPCLADFRALLDRDEVDDCFNVCLPPGSTGKVLQINATIFYDPADPPDDDHLLRDLQHPRALVGRTDLPYYEYVTLVDRQVDVMRATMRWDDLVKPWFDVWLPDEIMDAHLGPFLAGLAPDDVGPGGLIVIFAHRPSRFRAPFHRVAQSGNDRSWLLGVLTSSILPGQDPEFAARRLARNRAWFEAARDLGGVRYPHCAVPFSRDDWERHFGDAWPAFEKAKRRFDPDGILARGVGIFS